MKMRSVFLQTLEEDETVGEAIRTMARRVARARKEGAIAGDLNISIRKHLPLPVLKHVKLTHKVQGLRTITVCKTDGDSSNQRFETTSSSRRRRRGRNTSSTEIYQ